MLRKRDSKSSPNAPAELPVEVAQLPTYSVFWNFIPESFLSQLFRAITGPALALQCSSTFLKGVIHEVAAD